MSGSTSRSSPVDARKSSPGVGSSTASSFTISSRTRSFDTIDIRSRSAETAAVSSGTGESPNPAMKRAARSMRSGSSVKDTSGSMGVRSTAAARSPAPSKGSIRRGEPVVTSIAIELIVKSRRERSATTSSLNSTVGFRVDPEYCSARWVVISRS